MRVNRLAKSRENWKDTEGKGGHIGRALKFSLNRTNKKNAEKTREEMTCTFTSMPSSTLNSKLCNFTTT